MSYVLHKTINDKKYAYEVTSFRDPKTKKVKKKSLYLGVVNDDGSVKKRNEIMKELGILDFGDSYLIYEFFKQSNIASILLKDTKEFSEIIVLIIYRICYQSAMYNANTWFEGNILSILFKNIDLSSQNISRILAYLGQEEVQRAFFENHLNSIVE